MLVSVYVCNKETSCKMTSLSAWVNGLCIGSTGNNCRKRHFYQEGDTTKFQTRSDSPSPVSSKVVEFSSPLVVKVRKEVTTERREEVDLETGRRRSWVESKEFDVLDLTGDILGYNVCPDSCCVPGKSPVSNSNKPPLQSNAGLRHKKPDIVDLTGDVKPLFAT